MSMPETDIGQTAHDFVQALGGKEVRLVWSRRSEDAPLVPSRWVLRLQMILKASGLTDLDGRKSNWSALAQRLAEPDHVIPCRKPQARPPVAQRPRQISVTRVETLIRDPYAIYAREILKLEPLEALSSTPDVTHRGIIFHAAIGSYLAAHPAGPAPGLDELLRLGAEEFRSIAAYPELAGFWWPRFCRIAEWLVDQEPGFRAGVSETAAERRGLLTMEVAGEPFALVSRADRIDVFAAGGARISDYKTGRPPNAKQVQVGLAPQLTLQAAMLARGAMEDLGPQPVRELRYVLITGGDPPGRIQEINLDIAAKAEEHLAGLKTLLLSYANANQPYLPRVAVEREDEEAVFDHLSRYREWSLSGEAP
jgi:ATP-dependent helicase/nuclease subunit B